MLRSAVLAAEAGRRRPWPKLCLVLRLLSQHTWLVLGRARCSGFLGLRAARAAQRRLYWGCNVSTLLFFLSAHDTSDFYMWCRRLVKTILCTCTWQAYEQELAIVPVLNKVDLPSAEPDKVAEQMQQARMFSAPTKGSYYFSASAQIELALTSHGMSSGMCQAIRRYQACH